MKTLAQQYRKLLQFKNVWATDDFLKDFAIVNSRKYFREPIEWYCHVIIFVDGSTYIISYKVFNKEKDTIDFLTGSPDIY